MLGRVDVLKYIGKTILGFHKNPYKLNWNPYWKLKISTISIFAAQELEDLQSTI